MAKEAKKCSKMEKKLRVITGKTSHKKEKLRFCSTSQ